MSNILVIAEHDGKNLSASFAKLMGAASKLGGEVTAIVAGSGVDDIVNKVAQTAGVTKVVVFDDTSFVRPTAELWVENLAPLASGKTHIMAAASTYSRGGLARLAARLKTVMLSDIVAINGADSFTRPIYAGAVNADIKVNPGSEPIVMTVRFSSFDAASEQAAADIEKQTIVAAKVANSSTDLQTSSSERPDLGSARVVISGGRGVGSKENFALIEKLADTLGAAIGASRAAVDAGYVSNDLQVGQTGKVVAPALYFAIGISGAVQHLAGIKGAKTIIAINKDPNAPIFGVADYGLVGDLFTIIPELIEQISKEKAA